MWLHIKGAGIDPIDYATRTAHPGLDFLCRIPALLTEGVR